MLVQTPAQTGAKWGFIFCVPGTMKMEAIVHRPIRGNYLKIWVFLTVDVNWTSLMKASSMALMELGAQDIVFSSGSL